MKKEIVKCPEIGSAEHGPLGEIWIQYPLPRGAEPFDVYLAGDTTCEGVCLTIRNLVGTSSVIR